MKPNPIPLIAAFFLMSFSLAAQENSSYNLLLRSGSFTPEKNITAEQLDQFNNKASRIAGQTFAIIQFEQIPSTTQKEQLQQAGIELLDYIPNNAYTVTVSGSLSIGLLVQVKARAVVELLAEQKMQPELAKGIYPSWATKVAGTIDVWISFPRTFSFGSVQQELRNKNFEIIADQYKNYRIVALRIPVHQLSELALLPCIEFVQAAPAEDKVFNYNSMFAARANTLKASLANGGRDLNGQGVVVGIGDDGDIQTHLDFTNRIINRTGEIPRAHASHVAGTVGGAGIIQELLAGYAPKTTLIGQVSSQILAYAPTYVQDHGMVITNNSYGSVVNDCAFNGLYDLTSRILDLQAFDWPELQHVFAAGNDGGRTCLPYTVGFKNVLGGYQSAKNIICVGSTDYKRDLSAFSSKGPVRDGRLKPDIMSMGQLEASTWVNNLYSYNNGTSMAAPGVSGGLALLVQRYRQLNAGANPKNGLLKALICNGGDDRGNNGPDFSYGFGSMNLLRSIKMMEGVTYFNTTITQGSTISQTINIPANTAQLKVLLYWNDPAASVMATKTLVNDLDLQVDSSGTNILPFKLDTLPANVNVPAIRNPDHYNNIEQVVINNPAAGSYDLKVLGTLIAQGPSQEYFLAYDIIPQSLVLTNPVGGERLVPFAVLADPFYIQWDSYSDTVNTFTVEFFNGTSWSTLSNNVSASLRHYSYQLPNIPTDAARVRVTKNNTAFTQTSNPFVIAATATVSLDGVQCEGYIKINWTAVAGATSYEVMMLQGDEMVFVDTTTAAVLTYTFKGLSKDSTYWVAVRPRINGNPGRRATAISRQPNNGSCAGAISDNDLKVDLIVSPSTSGRLFTSTALSNSVPMTIRIKNLDDVLSTDSIFVSYSINAGTPVIDTIISPAADITAGGTIDHTFGNIDLSVAGTYSIQVTATKKSDSVTVNNSLTKVFKQLNNPVIVNGDLPWLDNLESTSVQTVNVAQMGLAGSDRYDFVNSTANGRLRSFINSGIAYSGTKAVTLDVSLYNVAGNTDSLTGTFNLGTFGAADEIRLDFRYKNHNQKTNAANNVWIRGSDAGTWIPMYDLFANQPANDGSYKLSGSLELNDSLTAHGQSFTSSFQVRWGQWGQYMAADNESGAGYSFDDIRIYRAIDDLQMISIDDPSALSCSFGSAEEVTVTLRNTSNASVNNIPIVLRVDGVIADSKIITTPLLANSTAQYTFTPGTANLSAPGNHTIEVWLEYATDNVRTNDTARITVNSLPFVNTFPYLQDFETNNGYWYTDPTGSSWQYGTPNSPKVRRAASGTKAWKTNLTGYYGDGELSYLYSPCFDLSGMTTPTLSFSLALDMEDCGADTCDIAWVDYSDDGGSTWNRLGAFGQGTNWYNKNYINNNVWSQQDYTRWHVATTALPTSNNSNIRFRFAINSDGSVRKDGMGVDDIHIYDNINGIYDGVTMGSPVMQTINGGEGWVNFIQSGKLVASVNSPVSMGNTAAQAYINVGPVRINSDQYYHDRNITIKPTTVNLPDSALVRFYFLDTETETLISATGCSYCFKPAMAYELGVTKYSDPVDANENGTLADNTPGLYQFITTANRKLVPFDKGYYAEFKVKDFSEFWLNNGGFNNATPLPLQLLVFTAKKQGGNVLTEWITTNESNVNHFDIELAKGNNAYQQNLFVKIGEVRAVGNTTTEQHYSFPDLESNKNGVRYYRLRIVDNDGRFTYSAIRPVVFTNDVLWQVYPNPSAGLFNFVYQADDGMPVTIKLYDANGRTVKQYQTIATGFEQKISIDLRELGSGLYLIEAIAGEKKQSFRLIKQ